MKINDGDYIVTAWAEPASGPGWANRPVWVLVRNRNGEHRVECLQPSEHTEEMAGHYPYSALASGCMTKAARRHPQAKKARPAL